jgi:hypothetical protein
MTTGQAARAGHGAARFAYAAGASGTTVAPRIRNTHQRKGIVMRRIFLVTSSLALLSVVAQFYFAGVGAFHRPFDHEGFALHAINAGVVQGLALFNAIAAAAARAGRGTIGLAALPLLLVNVQYAIFALAGLFLPAGTPLNADGIPLVVEGPPNFVVALHVINALTILWMSIVVFRRARRLVGRQPAPAPQGVPSAAPVAGR